MNRIRLKNGLYQVLVSPSMDYLLPRWNDLHLAGISLEAYGSLQEAQARAFQMQDLDWNRIIEIHQEEYRRLSKLMQDLIKEHRFCAELTTRLRTPEALKNRFFDLLEGSQSRGEEFHLPYRLNDTITLRMTNPWSRNLGEMAKILQLEPEMRIERVESLDGKIIRLTGRTLVNTTFLIQLVPTVMAHWLHWDDLYVTGENEKLQKLSQKMYLESLQLQETIDQNHFYVR